MANAAVLAMIYDIIEREGAYTDHPADRGGPTNWGITQSTLSSYLGHPATIAEVKALAKQQAVEIYERRYYLAARIDDLPDIIQPVCFDICVNSGQKGLGLILQRVLNDAGFGPIKVDGVLGPISREAARNAATRMGDFLVNALVEERNAYLRHIVINDKCTNTACAQLGLTLDDALLDRMLQDNGLRNKINGLEPKAQSAFIRGWINRSEQFRVNIPPGYLPAAAV